MQLPYMTSEMLKKLNRKGKATKQRFREFVTMTPEERGLSEYFVPEELQVVESAIRAMPKLTLEAKGKVKGSERMFQEDVLTIDVIVTRLMDTKDEAVNELYGIHTNHFPFPKPETFWIIVASKEQHHVFHHAKLSRPFAIVHKEFILLLDKVSTDSH